MGKVFVGGFISGDEDPDWVDYVTCIEAEKSLEPGPLRLAAFNDDKFSARFEHTVYLR